MDPRLLQYYNRELHHVREMGAEFAQEFPKIAGRLGLEGLECADPYVERLLEGFAFMAARVQLKIDAEFPAFTRHLLEAVFPHYLAPTPSMAVVQFQPDLREEALAAGFVLPRGTVLHSVLGEGEQTPCEYRTGQDSVLWPLQIEEAEYLATPATVANTGVPSIDGVRAGIRIRLRTSAGLTFDKLALENLTVFLRGSGATPMRIYEQLVGHAVASVVRPAQRPAPWHEIVRAAPVRRVGFDPEQALLPYGPRSFEGYRLLHEYFAFPERFLFVELADLGPGVRRCVGGELEVIVLLDEADRELANVLDAENFALGCAPAINLFPRRSDRLHLSERTAEYHVVPDRTRPMDYEVYEVSNVVGYGSGANAEQNFLPFYAASDRTNHTGPGAFYTINREPRRLSSKQRAHGTRTSYVGSELFVSLVDADEGPYRSDLRQLGINTLCTNRDLPLLMPLGKGSTDFNLQLSAPVESVRCVAGPTQPRPSWAEGETAWRLISHLSLNYLTLANEKGDAGAASLRELLALYSDVASPQVRKQIEGVKSVTSVPVTRRIPLPGPIVFGRGLEVTLICDESAFEGVGVFLFGAVLEEFVAKYVSINSFTETVIQTEDRGEIMRWPVRLGRRRTF